MADWVAGRPQRRILRREPIGVVGAITPWNVPLYLNIAKIGASLASGCTVVLKPAPDTPWSGTIIGRIAAEKTDIPPGVLNIVASSDHLVGEVLSPHGIRRDRVVKMGLYARHGVPYYWLIDPSAATLEAYALEGGRWVVLGTYDRTAVVRIPPFEAIEFVVGDLFPPGLPDEE